MNREDAKREMLFAKRNVMAGSWIDQAYDVAIQALSEPERKKGKWIAYGDIPKTCSCCHEDWDEYVEGDVWYSGEVPNYCPNCGSYNGGEQDEQID